MSAKEIVDLATLIAAVAGLATAAVALWNIRELQLMRQIASSPVLVTKDESFIVVCDGNDEEYLPAGQAPQISVINFGNGPALHAQVKWEVPDQELIKVLKAFDPHDNYKVGFEKSPFADDPCLRLYWNHFVTRQVKESLNPIVASKAGEGVLVKLPPYYLQAFHLYVTLAVHSRSDRKTAFRLQEFPSAIFSVSYQDLANNVVETEFRVTLSYEHNATHGLKAKDAYACMLQVVPVRGRQSA